jgi:hypothetical protein
METGHTDLSLRALSYELKNPLIRIARQAEMADPRLLSDIQSTAEQSLQLIDSFLLHAQTEYGQTQLDLSPAIIGSVLYDVSASLRTQAERYNVSLIVDDRTHEPVMTHRPALISILTAFAGVVLGLNQSNRHNEVFLRGFRTKGGELGIGIFSGAQISQNDISRGLELQGKAHLPLSRLSDRSHVSLSIADGLCRAVGGAMMVKRMGGLSGLATVLPRSEQLSLV